MAGRSDIKAKDVVKFLAISWAVCLAVGTALAVIGIAVYAFMASDPP